jgi:tetratricopeptide (TPR) repeat protein
MGAEGGSEAFFAEAEKHYLRAVELAPVTRLFYENLLLLYARFAKVEEAGALLGKVEAADKELAPSLLVVGASTLSQWSRSGLPTWTPAAKAAIAKAALDWSRRGLALEPGNAEYALATAVFAENAGDRGQARRWVDEALRLRPGYPDALQYKAQKRL